MTVDGEKHCRLLSFLPVNIAWNLKAVAPPCVQYNSSVDVSVRADPRPSDSWRTTFLLSFCYNPYFEQNIACYLFDHIYCSRNESIDSSHKGETAALKVKLFVFWYVHTMYVLYMAVCKLCRNACWAFSPLYAFIFPNFFFGCFPIDPKFH